MVFKLFTVLTMLAIESYSDTKVWLDSTEIYDPKNWKDGKVQDSCNGLVFAQLNDAPSFINNLRVKQLVLPRSGTVRFEEGSTVVFDEESHDDLNCVELNPFWMKAWYNVSAWKNLDDPDNPAIPYSEVPPSKYDDVILPKGFNSSIICTDVTVKSFTFGTKKLTEDDLIDLLSSEVGLDVFPSLIDLYALRGEERGVVTINEDDCTNPTGCDRRTNFENYYDLSYYWYLNKRNKIQCEQSITPYGNLLVPICGAQIIIETLKRGFNIDKINRKLKSYSSYTHASKHSAENRIQIIFTEKEYTGVSLIEATEFYNLLQGDQSYFCEDITLVLSGPPLSEGDTLVKNVISVIFGTLLGVVVMFGLLFFVYSPTVGNLNLRNRVLGTRPLSTYILRYDTIEDRGYIVDGQSTAGSVQSLNTSFENPLYDFAPSTRSTSNETVASPKLEEDEKVKLDDGTKEETLFAADGADKLEDVDLQTQTLNKNEDLLLKDL